MSLDMKKREIEYEKPFRIRPKKTSVGFHGLWIKSHIGGSYNYLKRTTLDGYD
jgi:hypothetical protein